IVGTGHVRPVRTATAGSAAQPAEQYQPATARRALPERIYHWRIVGPDRFALRIRAPGWCSGVLKHHRRCRPGWISLTGAGAGHGRATDRTGYHRRFVPAESRPVDEPD